jgi:phosphatidate cytidylyltransferase
MRTRVISAIVLIPIVVAAVYFGGWLWAALVTLAAVLATYEGYGLARAAGYRPDLWLGILLGGALALSGMWPEMDLVRLILASGIIVAFLTQMARKAEDRSMADWMATITFPLMAGLLLSYGILLRNLDAGLLWTLVALILVWVNDSAAYLGGRTFGKRPFFPSLSPKKTIEGAISGTVAAVVVGFLIPSIAMIGPESLAPLADVSAVGMAALGLLVSIAGPAGDLSQSFLKRQVGVKDSGNLIPGHGGILDRLDSMLFAAPVVYYAAVLLVG